MRMKRGFDEVLSFETIEPSETHRFGDQLLGARKTMVALFITEFISLFITACSYQTWSSPHRHQQTNMLDCDSTQRFQLAKPSAQLPFDLLHSLNCPLG